MRPVGVIPVLLAGGSGTRLWPTSRVREPKPFARLVAPTDGNPARSLLQGTALRVTAAQPPIVVTAAEHRFAVADQLAAVGITPAAVLLEPAARGTAPAVAAACHAAGPEAIVAVLPTDHWISDLAAFHEALAAAVALAEAGALVVFGVPPASAHTGFGYVRRGEPLAGGFRVARFVEKPDLARANAYVEAGDWYWNAGMFVFRAGRYLEELARFEPVVATAVAAAMRAGGQLGAEFAESPSQSVDRGVLERTAAAAVVPLDAGWSDLGSWGALHALASQDAAENAVSGDVLLDGAAGCYVRAEGRLVVALDVRDLAIIETPDAVLVASLAASERVKDVATALAAARRREADRPLREIRPWGRFEVLARGPGFVAKRLVVAPGGKLSLQRHRHRAEHWLCVHGGGEVMLGGETRALAAHQTVDIPAGVLHRLSNPGPDVLEVIEIQTGELLSEDDIERVEDAYGRV